MTIFTNAHMVTLSDAVPAAEALCVAQGRILFMGSLAHVRSVAGAGAEEIDLGGGVVYPGFIDTHSHLSAYANCLNRVDCGPAGL